MTFISPFERQERNTRWLAYALGVLLLLATYGVASLFFGSLIGFVVCVPIIGAYASWLIINHGAKIYGGLRWLALHKVNGRFRAFEDIEVCVEWHDRQCRVAAHDVFNVMHEKPDKRTCRRLALSYGERGFFQDESGRWWFGEASILAWLNQRAHKLDEKAHRFHRWLERDIFPPLHKQAEIDGLVPIPPQPASIEKRNP